jgi:hypothetical protein
MNNKYFTAEKIFARLAKVYKSKMQGTDIGTIIEWCAEIELEVLGNWQQFVRYDKYEITVVDGKALLPCNIYRLLDVVDGSEIRMMNYHNNGAYLSFSEYDDNVPSDGSSIYINFLGIAIDPETGYPLLLRGHEQALYWGCAVKLHEEEFSQGKLNAQSFNRMVDMYEVSLRSADTGFRHFSKNDAKEYMAVILNAIQQPNRLPLNL